MHKIFVYGTLRSGEGNHHLLQSSKFLGLAISRDDNYVLAGHLIPFLFESNEPEFKRAVIGELYEVDDATLARLDRLEGHPRWYERKVREFRNLADNQTHSAWVYLNDSHTDEPPFFTTKFFGGEAYDYREGNR